MSLKELVRLCKKQDRKAQEKLYRDYSGELFVHCLKYSADYEQAKDLLQDSFIKIFQNIGQYSGKGTFEGWMTRIVINTAIKKAKRKGSTSVSWETFLKKAKMILTTKIYHSNF